MDILGFDHLHVTVTDLEKAIDFYRELGFKLVRKMEHGGASSQMRAGDDMLIELHEARATENPGYNHFAVTVQDLDAAVKALQEKGVPVDGPVEVPATGRRLATVRDPNGSLVQLVEAS
jgi:catechol 2,3-dioxygenase-like lactoylglutathione lyase family enzyme